MTDRSVRKSIEKILRTYGRELFDSHVAYVDGFCEEQSAISPGHFKIHGGTVRRRYRRVLIAAAIIVMILAMAATAIGVVRPQIFYEIKEKLTHWDIQFTQNSDETVSPGFEYIRPPIPEGYRITEEVKTFEDYDITMEDDAGHVINYLQMGIDGTSLDLFNEKEDIRQTEINGRNAIVSHNGEMHTILIEDGKYAYLLEGECDYHILMKIAEELVS